MTPDNHLDFSSSCTARQVKKMLTGAPEGLALACLLLIFSIFYLFIQPFVVKYMYESSLLHCNEISSQFWGVILSELTSYVFLLSYYYTSGNVRSYLLACSKNNLHFRIAVVVSTTTPTPLIPVEIPCSCLYTTNYSSLLQDSVCVGRGGVVLCPISS